MRVIQFLTGPMLRLHTRRVAEKQQVPHWPGASRRVRVCEYHTYASQKEAFQLARLCVSFCEALKVPAKIKHIDGAYQVCAETNHLGAAILRRHPGVPIRVIRRFLQDGNVSLSGPFWWLPNGIPEGARVNPLLRCISTPDYQEYAKVIIFL
jgi:hypothetical protein